MNRTGSIKPRSPQDKRARTKRRKLLGKAKVARSAVSKGPARDKEHLAKVRGQGCLVCERLKATLTWFQWGNTVAHHPRELFPRTAGKRISDYLAVPLCDGHHSDQSPLDSVHKINRAIWWSKMGVNPIKWIAAFSPEGRAELARIQAGETGRR